MKNNNKRVDMLNGSLLDKLLLFAIPLALSSILQQLFNSVDVAVVGKFDSSSGQAAVGCNGPVINLLINIFVGISVGANVVISTYIGQNKKEKVKATVHTAMVISLIAGIIIGIAGFFVAENILRFMDTPGNIIDAASLYLKIYFLGIPFIIIYNFAAAVLRCVGNTKTPLYALIISGIINTILNIILVVYVHMGVAGVAIATVVSNIVSSAIVLYYIMKTDEVIKLSLRDLKIYRKELSKIIKIGVPAAIQTSVFSIANIFIQMALNGYGKDAIAGSAVTLNYEFYEYYVVIAFGQAAVTFISQNFGAGNLKRCRKIFYESILSAIISVAVISAVFVTGRDFFIGLFTSNSEVAHFAEIRMLYLLIPYILITTYEIGGCALRGMGYSMTPAVITIIGTCVLRLTWIYTICIKIKKFKLLMIIYPISWSVTGVICLITYFCISAREIRIKDNQQRRIN